MTAFFPRAVFAAAATAWSVCAFARPPAPLAKDGAASSGEWDFTLSAAPGGPNGSEEEFPPVPPVEPSGRPAPPTPGEAHLLALSGAPGPGEGVWGSLKKEWRRAGPTLAEDTLAILKEPGTYVLLGMAAAGSAVARNNWDDGVARHYAKGKHEWGDTGRDVWGAMGNPGVHFGAAGALWLHGVLAEDRHTYELSRTLFSGLIINGLVTMGMKWAWRDESPNGEEYAFPSGHTSSTMTVAAILDEAYGPWVGIPAYGVVGMVAWTRIEDREHWLSDVVFGAALGYVVGKTVARNHREEIFGLQIVPLLDPQTGAVGLSLAKSF